MRRGIGVEKCENCRPNTRILCVFFYSHCILVGKLFEKLRMNCKETERERGETRRKVRNWSEWCAYAIPSDTDNLGKSKTGNIEKYKKRVARKIKVTENKAEATTTTKNNSTSVHSLRVTTQFFWLLLTNQIQIHI